MLFLQNSRCRAKKVHFNLKEGDCRSFESELNLREFFKFASFPTESLTY